MERSPATISPRKFARMGGARRHRILAELVDLCLEGSLAEGAFSARYEELKRHAELDDFKPPSWLDGRERLLELRAFHDLHASPKHGGVEAAPVLSWQPSLAVEVVVDAVRSPYNAGSILRLIDNFGFERLVHAGSFPSLEHPRLKRSARGTQAWIPTLAVEDLPAWLQARGRRLVGIEDDPSAVDLDLWQPQPNTTLILGNETYGIARSLRALCHQMVRIPLLGYKKSMNVSHAFAVVGQRMVEKLGPSDP